MPAWPRRSRSPYIFKASYDKANRTSLKSYRGPGMKEGLAILRKVAETVHVPVLTDVHDAHDVATVAEYVDVVQVPAFLCRQTDLLIAAAKSGRAVNIKKGQFVSPWDMRHAVEKVRESGNERVLLTERGVVVRLQQPGGGHALAAHHAAVCAGGVRRHAFGAAAVCGWTQTPSSAEDGARSPSSAVQSGSRHAPGCACWVESGGQPEFIPILARAAVAAGVDGVFIEVHDNPAAALSDGANALDLKWLRPVLQELQAVHAAVTAARSNAV